MSELIIFKGEEFKVSVKEEINENDIFIDEYRRAMAMLDEIVMASNNEIENMKHKDLKWKQSEFENNIIAFCGDRGEGKSSAMMTFINAVRRQAKKQIGTEEGNLFSMYKNLQNMSFVEPIVIDPSLFDDVHNVLDIVLAKIFRDFYEQYDRDNQCIDERRREQLLDQFQKVYRYISLINNQKQMLDDEFDYEGNISKLTKLGESTNLKEELIRLISYYLEFLGGGKENQQLIIAIDDLDLCSANAYKMTEQIRKYLIIPHVTIVMCVRIEQLELCIREKNLHDFVRSSQNKEENIYKQLNVEVQNMAERYVAKLIPKARRIYLPKVQNFEEVHIVYKIRNKEEIIWDSGESNNMVREVLDLIYARTGMRFLPEKGEISYLLPDNLRDMINWIVLLAELREVDPDDRNTVQHENIREFDKYFKKEWMAGSFEVYNGLTLYDMGSMDTFHMHTTVRMIIAKIYSEINGPSKVPSVDVSDRADSFFQVVVGFESFAKNVSDMNKEKDVYGLRVLYTIRISQLLNELQKDELEMLRESGTLEKSEKSTRLEEFVNGYIWGPGFAGILPVEQDSQMNRSRFSVRAIDAYNVILKQVYREGMEMIPPEWGKVCRAPRVKKGEDRKHYIKVWVVLGLLSNVYYMNGFQTVYSSTGTIIYGNSNIIDYVHISLENYIVSLCNLDSIYHKVNMEMLGIKEDEFQEILREIRIFNESNISCARKILANMDLILGIKEYCIQNHDYKSGTDDVTERSIKLADKFFANIEYYMKKYGMGCETAELKYFSFGDEEKERIDISQVYAKLFDAGIQNQQLQKELEEHRQRGEFVQEFRKKLTEFPTSWNYLELNVSSYLKNITADNAKKNLDNLAMNVQRYIGEHQKSPTSLDVDGLCNLYSRVIELFIQDKRMELSNELREEYKRLVNVQQELSNS